MLAILLACSTAALNTSDSQHAGSGDSGVAGAQLLRPDRTLPQVCVASREYLGQAFGAGAAVVLDKPFAIRDLLATAHHLLNLAE